LSGGFQAGLPQRSTAVLVDNNFELGCAQRDDGLRFGEETTACTVQNATRKTYNYSISVGTTNCVDPSVVVEP
jgi:hypothetical protein